MKRPSMFIIVFRYCMVAGLLYSIWMGYAWAYKLTLTLVIFHSELLYILERLKDVDRGREERKTN